MIRRYRMITGYWGLGFNRHGSHWSVTVGPWVFTSEPE